MALSVVVPAYRSADSLPELVSRLEVVLAAWPDSEVIIVDDGSGDDTWATIDKLAANQEIVRPIKLRRNFGQHNALLCGLRAARNPITVTIDDDLQHRPEDIPDLVAAMTDEVDVVYGTPAEGAHGFMRVLASRITKIALRGPMGRDVAGTVSAFRVFRTELRDGFEDFQSPFVSLDVLLSWTTKRFSHLTVVHEPRRHGESTYSISKLITHAANMATGFSVFPLQVASLLGLAATGFGIGLLAFVVARWLFDPATVPGFTFVASAIVLFGGIQLFALGIIGEYIARIHLRSMQRPVYVVEESPDE